ncbi:hypothetical protein JR316_0013149 [Psilocybe cubensis]|uniref:F-box domain-containing protein n=2 Tax=Psilocybe cubensis TaxID=181762 RepID=A0A8H7XU89_PSICU|nr:hypothetical protein JR316_0013149 [Psilocybe cubensis]KAH9474684.1 hypothetical protein JR316_0013149 [Psilocybe cubensis]
MVSLSMSVQTSLSPVSSLHKLLKSNLSIPPPPASSLPTHRSPVERLPAFIIQDIARQSDLRDVLSLSSCSRRLSKILGPVLYANVELKTNKHCKTALIALAKRPDLTQHIRRLVVRPNCVEWTDSGDEMDEDLLATLIARMAPRLQALEAFEWDGLEMPGPELWDSLRTSCHNLKRIGTTIGENSLDSSSPLWDFDDLRQFSIKAKCQSLDWLVDGPPKVEKLPRRFWAMILERSPRLEELTIGGPAPSPRMFDIRHVTLGRWTRLKTLVLGDTLMIASHAGEDQARKDHAAFMAFFIAHPGLRHISLQHAGGSAFFPGAFVLPSSALPNVDTFGGPLKFVKTLPFPQRLRHLKLTSLHHTASSFPPTFAFLQELRWLESLSIWIDLSFGSHGSLMSGGRTSGESLRGHKFDDLTVLNNLVYCRPGLRHLEVACFSRPTFNIRDFSAIVQRSPSLESFVLTKVHKSSDEDITRSAARIAKENPHLTSFTLRTTYDSWLSPGLGRVKQLGIYEILESFDMLSVSSDGSEDKYYNSETKLVSTPESEAPLATALLVCEWGQKKKAGKEQTKYLVHPLSSLLPLSAKDRRSSSSSLTSSFTSPLSSPTGNSFPPSSWQMQVQNIGLSIGGKRHSRSQSGSINRGSGSELSPSNSIKSHSSSNSQTSTKVQNWRPRRASCSAVVGATAGVWDYAVVNGGPAHRIRGGGEAAGVASSRSSFCSSRSGGGPISLHGHVYTHAYEHAQPKSQPVSHNDMQVTWAQSVNDKSQYKQNENVNHSSGPGTELSTSKGHCSKPESGARRNSISKGILQCRCSILRKVKGLKTHGNEQIDEGYVLV